MIGFKLNGALRGGRQHHPRVRQKRAVADYRRGITQHLEIVRAGRGGLVGAIDHRKPEGIRGILQALHRQRNPDPPLGNIDRNGKRFPAAVANCLVLGNVRARTGAGCEIVTEGP